MLVYAIDDFMSFYERERDSSKLNVRVAVDPLKFIYSWLMDKDIEICTAMNSILLNYCNLLISDFKT